MQCAFDGAGNRTSETNAGVADTYAYPATSNKLQSVTRVGVTPNPRDFTPDRFRSRCERVRGSFASTCNPPSSPPPPPPPPASDLRPLPHPLSARVPANFLTPIVRHGSGGGLGAAAASVMRRKEASSSAVSKRRLNSARGSPGGSGSRNSTTMVPG